MQIKLIIALIFSTLMVGCATRGFHIDVDSISAPSSDTLSKYILLPSLERVEVGDLQFQEYAAYVERALVSKGYTKANGFEDADIGIFLRYGIGDPQAHQYSYLLPTWGQTDWDRTGVFSSNTYGTISSYGNTGTYSGTTTYIPTYGITGYQNISSSYTTYFRFLSLLGIDLSTYRETEEVKEVWRTTVTSTGSSNDLRLVFPILVAASKPHIGMNTGKIIKVILKETDDRVTEIREPKSQ